MLELFDKTEVTHLFISIVTISLAFSLPFFLSFPIVLITVGLGFVLHEIAHKITAIKYGCTAYYRAWMHGLVLAIFLAIMTAGSLVFAAPGAVHIYKSNLTRRENGIISLAGPMTNVLLAGVFYYLALNGIFTDIARIGITVNLFLGFFNLIPLFILDGKKVYDWSPTVWAIVFLPLFFLNFFVRF
ncbi:MAG: site-2 protease family protein [DPANN group archaeon]|nr:site-2 protease family protein [DPANN group archaeon]